MADLLPYPGTPRWVKVFGIIAIVLVLFVLFVLLVGVGGPHGPGRHMSPGDAGGHPRWELLVLLGILGVGAVALNWSGRWPWWPQAAGGWPLMTMAPGLRKFVLTAHVTFSVGSLGAVAGFLALSVAGLASQDAQMVRAAYLAMELTARFVILRLILASLLADTTLSSADLLGLRRSIRTHAAGGLLVLLVPVALSIYKPRGLTRYGWRKQHEERTASTERHTGQAPS